MPWRFHIFVPNKNYIMSKSFTVVFIPNCFSHKEDPSDYKQWEDVEANTSKEACAEYSDSATIVSCSEN